jgi:hypothetical protein
MKICMAIVLALLSLTLFASCASPTPAEQEAARQAYRLEAAVRILDSTIYFRDVRAQPPVCYAYLPPSGRIGLPKGPALAAVPCEAVERLLINR